MIVMAKDKEIDTTIIPFIPVPAHIIKIGAIAVLGKALSITKNGSNIFTKSGENHSKIAQIIPKAVPIIRPKVVSISDIWICSNKFPFLRYSKVSIIISEGLLIKKLFIILRRENNSQSPIKSIITRLCIKSIKFLLLSFIIS